MRSHAQEGVSVWEEGVICKTDTIQGILVSGHRTDLADEGLASCISTWQIAHCC